MKRIAICLFMIIALVLFTAGCNNSTENEKLTLEQYNNLEMGATYGEVLAPLADIKTPEIVRVECHYDEGASFLLGFEDGVLVMKTKVNLE